MLFRLLQDYPADRLLAVGPAPRTESIVLSCQYRVLRQAPSARLNVTRLARLKRSFEAIGIVGRIPLSKVDSAVEGFSPDVVLSVMEQRDYVDAAHRFCLARKLPLVLVVHDRLESFEVVYAPFRKFQLRHNAETYGFASARLCVSPEMEESLRHVYGASGDVLYPSRSDDLVARPVDESRRTKKPPNLTLGYAGSLAYGYGDRMQQVMPVLRSAGVRLRIYSRDNLVNVPDGVVQVGASPRAEETWQKVKAECDAVWLPYSHALQYRPLYETHFPSKLSEYLALGMPVLISGPSYATGVKWGLRHDRAALTVDRESHDDLRLAAIRLRDDAALRLKLAAHSGMAGDAEFDPARIRDQFLMTLKQVERGSASQ